MSDAQRNAGEINAGERNAAEGSAGERNAVEGDSREKSAPETNGPELAARIRAAALDCGFTACGIIRIEEMKGYAEALEERAALFPESAPMFTRMKAHAEPDLAVPWARSVVICPVWYGKYRMPPHLEGVIGKSMCLDARKDPRSAEYKCAERFERTLEAMGLRCASKHDFGITALRWAAARAGIGVVRKNNFFYTEQGSWNMLYAYLIDRELELKSRLNIKNCPENCGLCVKACPTGALAAPFATNGVACVAWLNSFGTCAPGKERYDRCKGWIFGCDGCQDACPFNRKAWSGTEDFPGLAELAPQLSYERILAMDDDAIRALLADKFWYIKAEDAWKWKCNILNAMRNTYDEKYRPHIERALCDARAEVREMAGWVLESTMPFSHSGTGRKL